MKIALYIEDGLRQIVFTPQTDAEKSILAQLDAGTTEMTIRRGGFYACQGGWVREKSEETSTMIVLRDVEAKL